MRKIRNLRGSKEILGPLKQALLELLKDSRYHIATPVEKAKMLESKMREILKSEKED